MKSFIQYITEAEAIELDDEMMPMMPFGPEYPFPVDEDLPSRYPPIPLEPGDDGYVEPKIPDGWVNPYSVPVTIPFYGQPAWSPGFFQPMINPNYVRGNESKIPTDPWATSPNPFLKPGGIYDPDRETYPAIPNIVPRKFRF